MCVPELKHPNVINLRDVFAAHSNVHAVLDFCETDLEQIIQAPDISLTEADIKRYMLMMLRGVEYCHAHWVLHRVRWWCCVELRALLCAPGCPPASPVLTVALPTAPSTP